MKYLDETGLAALWSKIKSLVSGKANRIWYAVDSTTASTATKTLTTDDDFELKKGAIIVVRFSATNTASTPKFNVNGTGAIAVRYRGSTISTSYLAANRTYPFVYTGTYWEMMVDRDTTYSNLSLGGGLAVCSAADDVALTATLASYTLATNSRVSVRFEVDVPAEATLNINSKGAKAIYYQNEAIADGVIKAGTTATFVYTTVYNLVSMDSVGGGDLEFPTDDELIEYLTSD
jgi:hypothetical protein